MPPLRSKWRGASACSQGPATPAKTASKCIADPKTRVHIWNAILEAGSSDGLVPAGLGARDTLRFEAALPLYGHELSPDITPLEAGLGFFVKLNAGDFIGREALAAQKEQGVPRRIVGLEILGKGVARENYPVLSPDGQRIGHVTSESSRPA